MTLGERIRALRKQLHMTQKEFVKPVGIKAAYLSEIEKNKKIPSDKVLMLIENSYVISLIGENPAEAEEIRGAARSTMAPLLGKIPAGFPVNISEQVIQYISLPEAPPNSYALVVHGDSMSPTLQDGDYVLFVPNGNAVKSGDMVVVNNEWGETVLKRYREKRGERFLVSDNPHYPIVKPNEQYQIMGTVIAVWRKIKI